MRDVSLNGRQFNMTLFKGVQYLFDMGRSFRTQTDYVFAMADDDVGNQERLWKSFFGMIPKFSTFQKIFTKATANFGALVVDRTIKPPADQPFANLFAYRVGWVRMMDCPITGRPIVDPDCYPKYDLGKRLFYHLGTKYGRPLDGVDDLQPTFGRFAGNRRATQDDEKYDENNPQVVVNFNDPNFAPGYQQADPVPGMVGAGGFNMALPPM